MKFKLLVRRVQLEKQMHITKILLILLILHKFGAKIVLHSRHTALF